MLCWQKLGCRFGRNKKTTRSATMWRMKGGCASSPTIQHTHTHISCLVRLFFVPFWLNCSGLSSTYLAAFPRKHRSCPKSCFEVSRKLPVRILIVNHIHGIQRNARMHCSTSKRRLTQSLLYTVRVGFLCRYFVCLNCWAKHTRVVYCYE